MSKPLGKREESIPRSDVIYMINEILTAIHDQTGYWISVSADKDREHTAFNEGVSAAEEAVVAVLRRYGFAPKPIPDDEGRPAP